MGFTLPASFAFLQVGSTQNAFNPSILAVGRNPTHTSYFDDTSKSFVRFIAVVLQSFNVQRSTLQLRKPRAGLIKRTRLRNRSRARSCH
ncbi:hypothetical protein PISMIDRAFT_271919 [Pisolithus microcarpus 441]|uniref:Uncharacterized protein n=1 Tax=Pisolithus microcarpus 441 TaxID=765257 RepID=A0A0C9YMR0_9AGAM|nr:hypothetical protein PISMIDRAFT_271919 [Pisolithus microcarpus 441]